VVAPGGIFDGGPETTVRRLRHQGIVIGADVCVVRRTSGGGVVVAIGRSRIALDPTVAAALVVRPPTDGQDHTDPTDQAEGALDRSNPHDRSNPQDRSSDTTGAERP